MLPLCPQLQPFSEAPEQTPEKSPQGPYPSPPSRLLTPVPHKVQAHSGPRGLPTVERQRPLLRPTATLPRLLCGPGSAIGGDGGSVDWGVGVQGQEPRAELWGTPPTGRGWGWGDGHADAGRGARAGGV